jgi:hypothetical protein
MRDLHKVILTRIAESPVLLVWEAIREHRAGGAVSGAGHNRVQRPQGIVWPCKRATILPWSRRPTDCSPGRVCRYGTRYNETHNYLYFKSDNKPNDEVKNFRNNC